MDVTIYGICETGLQREINQDRIFYDVYSCSNDISAIAVAADGMGGHKNGEKASGYICDIIRSWWFGWVNTGRNTEFNKAVIELNTIIKIANREIYDNFQADGLCGTTISILFISHGKWHLTSAGDTRCYRLRHGILKPQLEQLNNDDTWENDSDIKRRYSEIKLKNHPDFGKLTKAIGAKQYVPLFNKEGHLDGREVFALCTDGVYRYCEYERFFDALSEICKTKDHKACLSDIAKRIEELGAPDNYSMISVRVD